MIISGAVFADRFISQHLTEYFFLGGTAYLDKRLYEIARVLKTLKLCLNELKIFYGNLIPPALIIKAVLYAGPRVLCPVLPG
jgi:hypothetical protein